MQITFDPKNPADLQTLDALLPLLAGGGAAPTAQPQPVAQPQPQPVAQPQPQPVAQPQPQPVAQPQPATGAAHSIDDVRNAFMSAIQGAGGDAAAVFQKVQAAVPGFSDITKVDPSQYGTVIAALQG